MNSTVGPARALELGIPLVLSALQVERLVELQAVFAKACNHVTPIAQSTRCWNRVALHHQSYRELRARFPELGSQMVCNAIYAVSRACRIVYQGPQSPFNIKTRPAAVLPLLGFMPNAPVYFDRHTLTLKSGQASLFTLQGRLHCAATINVQQQQHLSALKVQEIALSLRSGRFVLDFRLESEAKANPRLAPQRSTLEMLTEHVLLGAAGAQPGDTSHTDTGTRS